MDTTTKIATITIVIMLFYGVAFFIVGYVAGKIKK